MDWSRPEEALFPYELKLRAQKKLRRLVGVKEVIDIQNGVDRERSERVAAEIDGMPRQAQHERKKRMVSTPHRSP